MHKEQGRVVASFRQVPSLLLKNSSYKHQFTILKFQAYCLIFYNINILIEDNLNVIIRRWLNYEYLQILK